MSDQIAFQTRPDYRLGNNSFLVWLLGALFVSLFVLEFLVEDLHALPSVVTWVPELLSGIATLVVIFELGKAPTLPLRPAYLGLFVAYLAIVVTGWVLNEASFGTVIAGARFYFKFTPFFLLMVLVSVDSQALDRLWKLLTVLLCLQLPIILIQKYALGLPPDRVSGSLLVGSSGAFILISGVALVFSKYLAKVIAGLPALALCILFFFPTTLNETKGTIVLLPICVLVAFLALPKQNRLRRFSLLKLSLVFAFTVFVFNSVYLLTVAEEFGVDESGNYNRTLGGFVTNPREKLLTYLYAGDAGQVNANALLEGDRSRVFGVVEDVGITKSRTRRIDAVLLPFHLFEERPFQLALGLGSGNTMVFSSEFLTGEYSLIPEFIGVQLTFSTLMLETGLIGVMAFLAFLGLVGVDSFRLARSSSKRNYLGSWWLGVTVIYFLSMFYKDFIAFNAISYLFWLFSGLIAREAYLARNRGRGGRFVTP